MRQSQFFSKTQKQLPKDETSINAQLLIRGGFVDKLMAGVYSYLPLGLRVYKKVEQIIREEMNAIGGQELLLPSMHPKENWEKTGRWNSMDDLFKLQYGENKELALGPTHEEVISPLAKKMIASYKDLPKYVYQFQNKFRNEKRAKSGLLRGREFIMKDLYSFHTDQADLDQYYEKAINAYLKIYERCGLKDLTYLTFASGGTFSKYSHEFQTIIETGEDTIYICRKCNLAINKEIKDETLACPNCKRNEFKETKAVEVGNIFKLGTKYSEPFDLNYLDKNGGKKLVIMGCYGIGLSRLVGTIVEVCHDDKGIIWPETVAPYKYHLLSLGNTGKESDYLYEKLTAAKQEVLYDDRDITAGEKFAEADLIGCPVRLVLSEKTVLKDSVELKKRNENKIELVPTGDILKNLKFWNNVQ